MKSLFLLSRLCDVKHSLTGCHLLCPQLCCVLRIVLFSHSKTFPQSYVTTNKSTREATKKLGRDGEKPGNVYKHMTRLGVGEDTSVAEIMVKLPRNHREVVNLKKTTLDKDRRSHDSLYTMLTV